jgi:putative transposase
MARPHRHEEIDGFYHVCSRGNNRRRIFEFEADRRTFLDLVGRASHRYTWGVYAFCLMTNHYHLVLQIPLGGLSKGMCELNGGYSRTFNSRHGRTDHSFRNRFFATLIENEEHLLAACRYVVTNPVAAGLCSRPEQYLWSSYRASVGLELPPRFLAVHDLLALFGRSPRAAVASYREFVARPAPPIAPDWPGVDVLS